jgi:hypothetical protein
MQTARKAFTLLSKKLSLAPKTTDLFKQQLVFTTPPIPEEQDDEPMDVETPVPAPTTKTANPQTRPFSPPVIPPNFQNKNPYSQSRAQGRDKRKEDSNSNASSVDGKTLVLIPNWNIPVNDGTIRILLRWKTTSDVVSLALSQKSNQQSTTIHSLLKDLFSDDDDGLLYRWKDDGMESTELPLEGHVYVVALFAIGTFVFGWYLAENGEILQYSPESSRSLQFGPAQVSAWLSISLEPRCPGWD